MNERGRASLTAYEIDGLDAECNLADGHAKLVPLTSGLAHSRLAELASASQHRLETDFLHAFSAAAGQEIPAHRPVLFPSASAAVDSVAKLLAAEGRRRVGLLEPVFDNLALLLRRAGIAPTPVAENAEAILSAARVLDALLLVSPNNPTGWSPDPATWPAIGDIVRRRDCLLAVDRTFRFFRPRERALDELSRANPRVITIDDTGKTWSTLECKVSFVTASDISITRALRDIAEEITLNVSPISLALCTDAIRLESGARRIRSAVRVNRAVLGPALQSCGFVRVGAPLSFELVEIPGHLSCTDLDVVEVLARGGLAVLPGSHFYWHAPDQGARLIRLSLARPPATIHRAADRLAFLHQRGWEQAGVPG